MVKLITGGTGFIGAELARTLVGRGEEVVLFDVVPNWERIRDIKDRVKLMTGIKYAEDVVADCIDFFLQFPD